MSWDVVLLKIKIDFKEFEGEIPPLGERNVIVGELTALLPELDYSDKSWGIYDNESLSIEFNTGDDEILASIMLHIRGGGDPHVILKAICEKMEWYALDSSTGEFMDFENVSKESWEEFQRYRDKIINDKL